MFTKCNSFYAVKLYYLTVCFSGNICRYTHIKTGQPKAGLGPSGKNFLGPTARVDRLKTSALNRKDCHLQSDVGLVWKG